MKLMTNAQRTQLLENGRKSRATAKVMSGNTCASACVFVLAGAVDRTVLGPGIIHRPYRAAAETHGYDNAQSDFKQRGERIRAYLEELNVPVSLYDAMLAVSPEAGRRLDRNELVYYQLSPADPVWEEESNAADAKRRGLSMTEYLRRKKAVEGCYFQSVMQGFKGWDKCEAYWD